jgi:hypothetical protein
MDSKNVSKKSLKFNTAALWQKINQKRRGLDPQNDSFLKNFYSFSHIKLRESGIENQEPFSHQSRMFALLMRGRYYF